MDRSGWVRRLLRGSGQGAQVLSQNALGTLPSATRAEQYRRLLREGITAMLNELPDLKAVVATR